MIVGQVPFTESYAQKIGADLHTLEMALSAWRAKGWLEREK